MNNRKSIFAACLFALCAFVAGCSLDEEQKLADNNPMIAPATRTLERIQQRLDPIARAAQPISIALEKTANDGAAIGIPGASAVALLATAVGTLLGAYNERRTGTTPAKSALTQVVQSVEAAFPEKTDQQKAALAGVQDEETKRVVERIKGKG